MNALDYSASAGWRGRLELGLRLEREGTRLCRVEHEGPLRVQRVFHPEGLTVPHVYLLHPPGGVVGGDRLDTRITLGAAARALLTTPAAQKLYRSAGPTAAVSNELRLGPGSELEWLPGESLAFAGARATSVTEVHLSQGAAFIGWEISCFGMPARREAFDSGELVLRFSLWRESQPLLIESLRLEPASDLLHAACGLRGWPVLANLYAVPAHGGIYEPVLDCVRELLPGPERGLFAATALEELLVVRALARSVDEVRKTFVHVWRALRPALLGRPAHAPRIWAT
jgi:urease accessory protein